VGAPAGEVAVLSFRQTRILDHQMAAKIREEFEGLTACPRVLIDFESVISLGSAFFSALISLNASIRETGGHLKLCGMAPTVMDSVRLVHLDKLFDIYETQAEALAAFRT